MAIRHWLSLGALCLFLPISAGQVTIGGVPFDVDTLTRYQAGPGTWYMQVRLWRASDHAKRHDIYLLQVDRTNPYIQYQTVLANDRLIGTECPSAMAQRKTRPGSVYFAGTNGDFYNSGFRGFKHGVPDGTFITERTLAHTPLQGREPQPSTIVDSENRFYFGRGLSTDVTVVRPSGEAMRCNHVNYDRKDNELVIYNVYNGASTLTETTDGTEVRCVINDGQQWSTNGSLTVTVESIHPNSKETPLDASHIVLSGVGDKKAFVESLTVGEVLTLNIHTWIHTEGITDAPGTIIDYTDNYIPRYSGVYDMDSVSTDFVCALGGQDKERFLINGVILETWAENHPRTAIGASVTGDTIIQVVVDGRGASTGMTLGQMGQMMRYFGAWNAMNLEGGGSSAMYIRHKGVVNSPSDNGVERAESNGLFVVCNAPEDNTVARLVPYSSSFRLPKYGYARPQFMSYNQYGLMLSDNEQDLQLSCDPSVGYVLEDGVTFVALGSGDLTVKSGNAVCVLPVSVESGAQPNIRLDSVLVDAWSNYMIEINAEVDGQTMGILPSALDWTFDEQGIAQVDELGQLNGLTNGVTVLHGSLEGFSDDIQVRVEIADSAVLAVRYTSDTTVRFASTRAASLELPVGKKLFACPDSLRVTVNTDAPVASLEIKIMAADAADPVSYKIADKPAAGQDYVYRMAVADILNVSDQAIYPLTLDRLRFAFKDPKKNTDYTVRIKRIEAVYSHFLPTDLPRLTDSQPDAIDKMLRNGRLIIRKHNRLFDAQGQQIR